MKIIILGTRGFPHVQGGIESHCEHLYTVLAKNGCDVTVLTRKDYVDPDLKVYKDVRLIALKCPTNKFLETVVHTFKGIFVSRKLRCDILHVHAVGPALFIPLARLLGLKVVMTNHGPDYRREKWKGFGKFVLRLGEMLGSKWSNGIICISNEIAGHIKEKYKRDSEFIPNGVIIHQSIMEDTVVKRFGLQKGKYVLAVGRFVPEKGFHDLVNAYNSGQWSVVSGHNNDWKLVIVGDADHEDGYSLGLKEKASSNKKIVLTGQLMGDDLRELYSHAGIFVLPSYYEGLPIVLLEAMSYGLSCLVSDIPATREVDLDEERYFKAGDIQGLSAKIREFSEKSLSAEDREKQIKYVEKSFNWELIAARTLEVYKDCLKR